MKKGFGLLEVMAASIVLAFMLLGLNALQKGNREAILRVRARDGANVIAQDIIDSLSALGSASVISGTGTYERIFEGLPGKNKVEYSVDIDVREEEDQRVVYKTEFSNIEHLFARQVDVKVSWKFKNIDQSINLSAVIR